MKPEPLYGIRGRLEKGAEKSGTWILLRLTRLGLSPVTDPSDGTLSVSNP